MKTNIINILIIAILLIAGWSLFTILQDFNSSNPNKYSNYSMIGKSKQYLPLTPESYSSQRKYPVYKGGTNQLRSNVRTNGNTNYSVNRSYDVSSVNSTINNSGGASVNYNKSISGTGSQNGNSNAESKNLIAKSSRMVTPFSKSMKINTERNLAAASESSSNSIGGSSLSGGGTGMMKVFGGDEEGDAIEGGGGTENENFYNDVPVGDGYFLLAIMSLLYAFVQGVKKIKQNLQ